MDLPEKSRVELEEVEENFHLGLCRELATKFESGAILKGLYYIYFVSQKNGPELFAKLKKLEANEEEIRSILEEIDQDLNQVISYACRQKLIAIREGGVWGVSRDRLTKLIPGIQSPEQEFVDLGNWLDIWMQILSHFRIKSTIHNYPNSYTGSLWRRFEEALKCGGRALGITSNVEGLNS